MSPSTPDYTTWLRLLRLEPHSLNGLVVADYGAGPRGGILTHLTGPAAAYPLHRRATGKNRSRRRRLWHYQIYRDWSTRLADGQADAVFCLGMLDKPLAQWTVATELSRITAMRGRLYVGIGLRSVSNPQGMTRLKIVNMLAAFKPGDYRAKWPLRWRWLWWEKVPDLPNHRPDRTLLVGCLERIREEAG